jgi:hypothetical protein
MQLPSDNKMKKLICAALFAAAASAHADGYFLVVPVPGKAATAPVIQVELAGYALPGAVAGVAYQGFNFNELLRVTGDSAFQPDRVTWRVASGSLPAGMSLSGAGQLTGTPQAAERSSFTVKAAYKNKSGEQAYQLVTVAITVSLASATLPDAHVGELYSQDLKQLLSVSGDPAFTPGAVTWSVVRSTLPEGLALRTSGVISGTPVGAGAGSVTVRATYRGKSGEQTYEVLTLNVVVTLGSAELPVAQVGSSYSYDFKPLADVAGDPDYKPGSATWSMSGAPSGLALSPAGVLAGTVPAFAGTSAPVTVTASYKNKVGTRTYTLAQEKDPYWAQTVALLRMDGAPGSGSFVDLKGGAWTSIGADITAASPKFGQSGRFPGGHGKGITGPVINLMGDFTLEAWVNPAPPALAAGYSGFIGQWGQYGPHGSYLMGVQFGAIAFTFHPFDDSIAMMTGPVLQPNTWAHVAVTRKGSTFRLFVNGHQVSTATFEAPGNTVPIPFSVGDYHNGLGEFGASGPDFQAFTGLIDEVRVTAGVSRYNADFAPAPAPFPGR